MLVTEGIMILIALVVYKGRPKPMWLELYIKIAKWIAKLLRIIKRIHQQ
jgi:hypothetical protein